MALRENFFTQDIPLDPGVYFFRDRFGKVIYVGKASNLRRRLSQYFQPGQFRRVDIRIRSLINSIAEWEYIVVRSEDEALILESKLIKTYAPHYNVLMRDDKRYLLLKINLNEPFPTLRAARVRKDDQALYFGPFPQGRALKTTMDFLLRYFKLRSCSHTDLNEDARKHCLKRLVKDCSEPCNGKLSSAQYHEQVNNMLRVLNGNLSELTTVLEQTMKQSSLDLKFEKAARIRDIITNLNLVFGRHNRNFAYASIPSPSGMDAVEGLQKALGLPNAPKIIECYDISNILGTLAVGSMVLFENGKPARSEYRRFRIKTVHQSDDFAMMHEMLQRRFKRKLNGESSMPDLVVIDGGKGQLSAVIQALVEIGTPALPVIGLAKAREEIFLPGRSEPILLDRHDPALRLLQSLRDEAHRFAISYHRQLRNNRLQQSLLDDIPGIGPQRKKILLQHFGSVRELRKASIEQIVEKVPGIGESFAEKIYYFFHNK